MEYELLDATPVCVSALYRANKPHSPPTNHTCSKLAMVMMVARWLASTSYPRMRCCGEGEEGTGSFGLLSNRHNGQPAHPGSLDTTYITHLFRKRKPIRGELSGLQGRERHNGH